MGCIIRCGFDMLGWHYCLPSIVNHKNGNNMQSKCKINNNFPKSQALEPLNEKEINLEAALFCGAMVARGQP